MSKRKRLLRFKTEIYFSGGCTYTYEITIITQKHEKISEYAN